MKITPLVWVVVVSLGLSGCAGLAVTPTPTATPQASNRIVVAGGNVPGEGTPSTPISDTISVTSTNEVTVTLAPVVEGTLTPTITLSPTDTVGLTPTIAITATPDLNFTPIPPTATITITPTPDLNFTPITPTATPAPAIPIGLAADLGFRPRPNGYPFANYGTVYSSDFTTVDARRMFANDAEFCFDLNRSCQNVRLQLQLFTNYANSLARGGHCDGFTVTTLRFYERLDSLRTFRAAATTAYNLLLYTSVRRQIAYYWSLQIPDPVAEAQWRYSQQTPSQLLAQLRTAMTSTPLDPTTLVIYNWQGQPQGHSITPYAVEYLGTEVWHVHVYDNNWPGDPNRFVEINTALDTWSYFRGSNAQRTATTEQCGDSSALTWCGNATSHSLTAVPISTYTQTPVCRNLCRVPAKNAAHSLVSIDPDSVLLATDSQGRRVGIVDAQPVAEIPDSFLSLLPGGLDLPATIIDHLPVTDTYTYTISRPESAISTTATSSQVTAFGPGYASVVSDITLTGTQTSQLKLAPDGTQLIYHSEPTDRAAFKMVLESEDRSQSFDIGGLTIGTGRTITLTIDDPGGRFTLDNTQNISGTFDLTYTRVTTAGQQIYATTAITLPANARTNVNYGPWPGTGPITITVESSLTYYLPVILN
jgi:hypothetical protein